MLVIVIVANERVRLAFRVLTEPIVNVGNVGHGAFSSLRLQKWVTKQFIDLDPLRRVLNVFGHYTKFVFLQFLGNVYNFRLKFQNSQSKSGIMKVFSLGRFLTQPMLEQIIFRQFLVQPHLYGFSSNIRQEFSCNRKLIALVK